MDEISQAEFRVARQYNAASQFIGQQGDAGRDARTAFIDDHGSCSYGELSRRVNRFGNLIKDLGARPETRVALALTDTIDFPICFWGAMKAGLVPVPINTLLTPETFAYILDDCRAPWLVISQSLAERYADVIAAQGRLEKVIISTGGGGDGAGQLGEMLAQASPELAAAETTSDDVACWLYSSGSTGKPKGVMHVHGSFAWTAELFGKRNLGITGDDVVFSAAKLFFAYGLGNAMTFPLSVGATAILSESRPTPDGVLALLRKHKPTIFFGVPTLYAGLVALPGLAASDLHKSLRLSVSAGEALPAEIGKRWEELTRVPVFEGVGSTEMMHCYISSRSDDVPYGVSGVPVPGYQARLVDEAGEPVAAGELGEMLISGPTAANGYWNQRAKSRAVFAGEWVRTGDKYYQDEAGHYHFCGRSDDMFKCGGNWVSPFEVEAAIIEHAAVLEAAVVAAPDASGNMKPRAYVVLQAGTEANHALEDEIKAFVKERLELWKYPRSILFVEALPKTPTGKIQRFRLRQESATEEGPAPA